MTGEDEDAALKQRIEEPNINWDDVGSERNHSN
jgi:hypothetical protein